MPRAIQWCVHELVVGRSIGDRTSQQSIEPVTRKVSQSLVSFCGLALRIGCNLCWRELRRFRIELGDLPDCLVDLDLSPFSIALMNGSCSSSHSFVLSAHLRGSILCRFCF